MELKKILVIDDNTINLATVEKALKNKYEVVPMISGKRALKYLYCQRVDLILLDVEMPEMDGIETLEEIRKLESAANTPTVFLTAKNDKQTVLEGFRLRIMDYITKPIDPDALADRVEYILKRAGSIPFEKREILKIFSVIVNDIEKNDIKQAINRLTEALNYKTDEEITGRVRNALGKFAANDIQGGISVVTRTFKMLQMEVGPVAEETMLSQAEIKEKLAGIVEELDNFRTKEAIVKCKELLKFKLPVFVGELINKCLEYLNNYDDEEAEQLLKNLMAQMK